MRTTIICLLLATVSGLAAADQPTVDDLAWLAGSWSGEAFGGTFEETWNPPSAGSMVGLFKLMGEGEVQMYEIMRIAEVEGQIVLEVKHFTADFVAWEDKEDRITFRLEEVRDGYAAFKGLVFERQDDGSVIGSLAMKSSSGELRTETLHLRPVR